LKEIEIHEISYRCAIGELKFLIGPFVRLGKRVPTIHSYLKEVDPACKALFV